MIDSQYSRRNKYNPGYSLSYPPYQWLYLLLLSVVDHMEVLGVILFGQHGN